MHARPDRRFAIVLALALSLTTLACTRPSGSPGGATGKGTSRPGTPGPGAGSTEQPPRPALPPHPAEGSWPAAVQQEYRTLRSLDEKTQGGGLIKGILRLAQLGGAAAGALRALHDDGALPARLRTMAGVMYANLHRFDRATLAALLASSQNHVARHAALLLSQLGGSSVTLLAHAAQQSADPGLRMHFQRYAGATNVSSLPSAVLELLHTLLSNPDASKKAWAGTELAVRHAAAAEPALRALLSEATADAGTRLQAALALVEGHGNDVAKLAEYASRRHPTVLRLAACRQLASKGEAGRKVLTTLAGAAGDPLARRARELLDAKP